MSENPTALAEQAFADPAFERVDTCLAQHPEGLGVCEKAKPCYGSHYFLKPWTDLSKSQEMVAWPGTPPPDRKGDHAKAQAVANRTKASGVPADPPGIADSVEDGLEGAERAWEATDDAWKQQARAIADDLIALGQPFSGNDFWRRGLPVPISDGREERRGLGHVLMSLSREGRITNTGGKVKSLYGHGSQIAIWAPV